MLDLNVYKFVFPSSDPVNLDPVNLALATISVRTPGSEHGYSYFILDQSTLKNVAAHVRTNSMLKAEDLFIHLSTCRCAMFELQGQYAEMKTKIHDILYMACQRSECEPERSCASMRKSDHWRGRRASAIISIVYLESLSRESKEITLFDDVRNSARAHVSALSLLDGKGPYYEKFGFVYNGLAKIYAIRDRFRQRKIVDQQQAHDLIESEIETDWLSMEAHLLIPTLQRGRSRLDKWLDECKDRGANMPSVVNVVSTSTQPGTLADKIDKIADEMGNLTDKIEPDAEGTGTSKKQKVGSSACVNSLGRLPSLRGRVDIGHAHGTPSLHLLRL